MSSPCNCLVAFPIRTQNSDPGPKAKAQRRNRRFTRMIRFRRISADPSSHILATSRIEQMRHINQRRARSRGSAHAEARIRVVPRSSFNTRLTRPDKRYPPERRDCHSAQPRAATSAATEATFAGQPCHARTCRQRMEAASTAADRVRDEEVVGSNPATPTQVRGPLRSFRMIV
jgi:hypothetical protein